MAAIADGLEQLREADPRRIGPYALLARLRENACAVEFVARDADGLTVTVTAPHPRLAGSRGFGRKFDAESALAAEVSGPWVAPVREAADGRLVAAYRPSLTLGSAVDRHGPLPEHTLRILGAALAEVLVRLHRHVPVHQGLAPHTVLLAADGPLLAGFGPLAAATDIGPDGAGLRLSLGFLTPEQVARHTPGPASDVFMLALLLVYAATGRTPFAAATPDGIATTAADLTGVPEPLRPLLARCLDKDPDRRPAPADIAAACAPGGAAALLEAGWVSGPVVAELSGQAAAVLALEAPDPDQETPPPDTRTTTEPGPQAPPARPPLLTPGRRAFLGTAAGLAVGAGGGWALARSREGRAAPEAKAAPGSQAPQRVAGAPPAALWYYKAQDLIGNPCVAHDRTLILPAYGRTVGLDLRTGKERWAKEILCANGPVPLRDDLMLVSTDRGLLRFSSETGTVRDTDARLYGAGEILARDGDRLWFMGYVKDAKADADKGSFLICYDAWAREEVWRVEVPDGYEKDGVTGVLGETALFLQRYTDPTVGEGKDNPAVFLAVDRATGRTRWEKSYGEVAVKNYAWLSSAGVLYAEDRSALRAYDLESGKELWAKGGGGDDEIVAPRALLALGGALYVADSARRTHRVDARSGQTRWTMRPLNEYGEPTNYEGVAAGLSGTPLYRLDWEEITAHDPEDGRILWVFQGVGASPEQRGLLWRIFSGTHTAVFSQEYSSDYFGLPVG
ncbi:PQQ-binding-like beta-propeller repeat protein [Streptomyces sp. NBC_00249]|uniref:outer membrane protein assembly factor BamB family protein n=1 Tax=Streptomyces sp. NBC_00249 TaxID=2975690 RepID=UPI0022519F74|nr:PQQ-binding-like beta-propeller repeat protein [Streptomyces sp. NBC_00249]MCX5195450.1 PQQ-binding-like beta-propeller repeat protein [Streptomyces sp. NBC_00249]